MTGDPLQRFVSGEALGALRADTMNALVDAAKQVRRERSRGQNGASVDGYGGDPPYLEILVRNDTGSALGQWGVVRPADPLEDPTAYPFEVSGRPLLKGLTPTAGDTFAVTLEPIPTDQIGRAVVMGVAVANLSVTSSGDTYASCTTATDKLTTGTTGTAKILWKESGTGSKLGLVLMQGVGAGGTAPNDINGGITETSLQTSAASGASFPSGYSALSILSGTNLPTVSETVRVALPTPLPSPALVTVWASCRANLFVGTVSGATYGFFVVKAGITNGSGTACDVVTVPYPGRNGSGDAPAYGSATAFLPWVVTGTTGNAYVDVTMSYSVTFYSNVAWGGASAPSMRLRVCTAAIALVNPETAHAAFSGDWIALPLGSRSCPSVATI